MYLYMLHRGPLSPFLPAKRSFLESVDLFLDLLYFLTFADLEVKFWLRLGLD